MPPKAWKTLSSRTVYENPWTRVREDIAEMPNGNKTVYGVIECPDCVGVLPFIDDDARRAGTPIPLRIRRRPPLGDANREYQAG